MEESLLTLTGCRIESPLLKRFSERLGLLRQRLEISERTLTLLLRHVSDLIGNLLLLLRHLLHLFVARRGCQVHRHHLRGLVVQVRLILRQLLELFHRLFWGWRLG